MKLIKALDDITLSVENALVNAGLVDGLSLSIEEIKIAASPLFWFMTVKSKEASDKQSYLVWSFQSVSEMFGDGKPLAFPFEVNITLYSRNRVIDDTLEKIENAFIDLHYKFDFGMIDYDTNRMMYLYQFVVKAQVSEVEE